MPIPVRYSEDVWSNAVDGVQVVALTFSRKEPQPYRYLILCLEEKVLWRIDAFREYNGQVDVMITLKDDFCEGKIIQSRSNVSKEDFLNIMAQKYPDQALFFLWHPEIFSGHFLVNDREWSGFCDDSMEGNYEE